MLSLFLVFCSPEKEFTHYPYCLLGVSSVHIKLFHQHGKLKWYTSETVTSCTIVDVCCLEQQLWSAGVTHSVYWRVSIRNKNILISTETLAQLSTSLHCAPLIQNNHNYKNGSKTLWSITEIDTAPQRSIFSLFFFNPNNDCVERWDHADRQRKGGLRGRKCSSCSWRCFVMFSIITAHQWNAL